MKDTLKIISLPKARDVKNGRRQFLKGSIVLTGLLSSGSMLAVLAPSRSWALTAQHLNAEQANALLLMAKRLYPHKNLSDAVYAVLVKDIDAACADPANNKLVTDGIDKLNAATQGDWAGSTAAEQVAALKTMESDPFFQMIRGQCIHSLYDNEMAYAHFGYEGESWSKGGYLRRGFSDLTWLPNPSEAASPSL
ncbi:tat (twin-arginine translocation) pathway signal sequence [Paenalcaligenes niemegkensis]|uniref:tat (twin-arginine translocation) pathway signal sequence n=1 Tax=Paenalcaligenes niemegkensis TaxID=2895469 RepID=UPI001EE8C037|nr:tat (twin-arginine translocation) pathway signal sequence [Paenalcaligenes niemegkensis]MCQ9617070.1 tat (twin-arginine translocation) pathway signal sequence [Paenalcaligenes niemegkensis]